MHVYTGACLKSARIVCSLVWLVISPADSHEEKPETRGGSSEERKHHATEEDVTRNEDSCLKL